MKKKKYYWIWISTVCFGGFPSFHFQRRVKHGRTGFEFFWSRYYKRSLVPGNYLPIFTNEFVVLWVYIHSRDRALNSGDCHRFQHLISSNFFIKLQHLRHNPSNTNITQWKVPKSPKVSWKIQTYKLNVRATRLAKLNSWLSTLTLNY